MKQPPQFRAKSASASQLPEQRTVSTAGAPASVSFANDIMPLFKQFQGPMMWRLDLTSYDAVKANAQTIYNLISTAPPNGMPPPPFQPLTTEQIATFQAWMNADYPP